jgi:ubiquinone/menaquinone biosynthesis C-methylase UbiE
MADEPQIWHYGLMAERWAKCINDTPELDFYKKQIEKFGQPVLDVACGTGRLLLALLRAGIDMDGCDLSKDMLHFCRQRVQQEGFHAHLIEQPMHAFKLPRLYKTIYICDSFGLAGSQENDLETLRCCYRHLESEGALILNIQAEYADPETWQLWLEENRQHLPQAWPQEGNRRVATDGRENIATFRTVEIDPLEQRYTRQVRLEKWVKGELIRSEEYSLRGNMYFKNEVKLMLALAGFENIAVYGDYQLEPATSEHREIIFIATK